MPVCPYDKTHENNTKPSSGYRSHVVCPVCNRKALVVIHDKVDGSQSYSLARIGRYSLEGFAKKVRSVRLSDSEMKAVERGDLRLIVRNFRITVSA
jgi:hypothetical protein